MTSILHRPMILIILDGFGHSEAHDHNAIYHARTPHLDKFWQNCTHTLISGSGEGVGLPDDQMGNSEVGHLNLGAGRVVYQEFTRISKAIKEGDFFYNPVLTKAIESAIQADKAVHIMGLLSPGGVHSHHDHILASLELAAKRGAKKIYLHAILDGRDTPPKSAASSIQLVEEKCQDLGVGKIVTLIGRYYTMDRDQRWERVAAAYELMTEGKSAFTATSAQAGLEAAYQRGETDEFVKPTSIHVLQDKPVTIQTGDVVIFMNFRADRARQITRCFIEENFDGFKRKVWPKLNTYVCLTQYDETFNIPVAYPPSRLSNIFGEYLAKLGLKQLRIAETEKYAHVTFFFNGGVEEPFPGEDRTLIPSPKVATYDLQPQMSAPELTEKLIAAISSKKYDCIICNYANADMVGHTGNYEATIKAIECLDECIGKVATTLMAVGGEMIITADHGNADCMYDDKTKQAHTAHTTNLVPFIYLGRSATICKQAGILADVCPTMLYLMGLAIPSEMTGTSLLTLMEPEKLGEKG